MASPPQPTSISATERRPAPQYHSQATFGLSPPKPLAAAAAAAAAAGLAQLDESDLLEAEQITQHLSIHAAARRRRGQVSESEFESYRAWRLNIKSL